MKKEFVSYEIALELKELGFDEPCLFAYYGKSDISNFKESDHVLCGDRHNTSFQKDGRVSAPLHQQAFRWFREKYGVYARPDKFDVDKWWVEWGDWNSSIYGTYEEAEHEWLLKLIEIAKN
jgi:hypothetical protein